jgi:hypothetical protein
MTKQYPPHRRHFDEDGNETEWWSHRQVTEEHSRLLTGEPTNRTFVVHVKERVLETCRHLKPGRRHHPRWLFGRWDWMKLTNGQKRAVGRVLCDLAKREGCPFTVVKQGTKNRYELVPQPPIGTPPVIAAAQVSTTHPPKA